MKMIIVRMVIQLGVLCVLLEGPVVTPWLNHEGLKIGHVLAEGTGPAPWPPSGATA